MTTSLYDISVASYLQTVAAVAGVLEKGLAYCKEAGINPEDIVESRLCGDMLPFRFQVLSVVHHSAGALGGIKAGSFGPPGTSDPLDYKGLQGLIASTLETLRAYTPDEVNGWSGKDVVFKIRDMSIPFTAETFVLSFSLPNLHFHASTAYGILRAKGAPLGKRDYLGGLRFKTA